MRQHPTGQVIAEAMNHITILAWTGGKEKTMDIKMLDARQRIAAVEIPGVKAGVHIYYISDVIVINANAKNCDKIIELMSVYLGLEPMERLRTCMYTDNDSIKGILHTLDRIARIRRKLYRCNRA